jgi:hypothetical protein
VGEHFVVKDYNNGIVEFNDHFHSTTLKNLLAICIECLSTKNEQFNHALTLGAWTHE